MGDMPRAPMSRDPDEVRAAKCVAAMDEVEALEARRLAALAAVDHDLRDRVRGRFVFMLGQRRDARRTLLEIAELAGAEVAAELDAIVDDMVIGAHPLPDADS